MEQAKVNIKEQPDILCPKCEGKYYMPAVRFKKISAIMSKSGREEPFPIEVFACVQCGNIMDFLEMSAPAEEEKPKSNIITDK